MAEYAFDTKHDRYPVAVHVFLIDAAGRILLMRRAGSGFADGQLGLPAGHVDLGETPTASAVREVGEELGLETLPHLSPHHQLRRLAERYYTSRTRHSVGDDRQALVFGEV